MGTLADKLNYLSNSIHTIQMAIHEKGIEITNTDPLATYAGKIREIQVGVVTKGIKDVTDYVKAGKYKDLNIIDYNPLSVSTAFTEKDIICKDIEDITDTIIIIEHTYTNL